ncbi:MAG: aldehyde dehydrogenase family protein [Cryomorphaceae bacterium]|nr:aldehyde dehydrogenase family protein [Cryomorphaceae bacterium]
MSNAIFTVPVAKNEPVKAYAPGSAERASLLAQYKKMYDQAVIDVPMYIGSGEVRTENKKSLSAPHDHNKILGHYNVGTAEHVEQAIAAALNAKKAWAELPWEDRASIFLKAADLLAGPFRDKMNGATMLAQSKNVFQTEIDAACELIDFFRFNVQYMTQIYREQPESLPGMWNRLEYRPLEGFIFALTPFNFTSIAANLCAAPAMMGNVVVWKPAESQIYSAQIIMELFKAAGVPDGVINMVTVSGQIAGEVIFKHKDFAGLHFTGSTGVFRKLWKDIANNLETYRSYPRIVGETGGKDFVMVHNSANAAEVATALSRGAFEFQGQKCSAASRAYIPKSIWPEVKRILVEQVNSFKIGSPEDTSNFINVRTMCEEIFGPVLTIYVYEDDAYEQTLELVDSTSEYALTGSIIAGDRYAIRLATEKLQHAAGNFYINDKPTGAVVGQQPFGGARGSGTNDKAGAAMNLMRWVSARTIKETFVPPTDYCYPFLG